MKLTFVLSTLVVAALAAPAPAPAPHHNKYHHSSSPGVTITASTILATAVTAGATALVQPGSHGANPGKDHGGAHGGNTLGQQSTKSTARPQATMSTAIVATMAKTTARQGGQATNTASAGQGTPGSINPSLVPDFGQQAGLQPDGTGNCKTDTGKTIPCQCPPNREAFIAKLGQFVAAGSFFGTLPAPFPTGNSNQDALTRIDTIISALQNFDGKPGVGCPAISAPNFSVVQQKLQQAL